MTYGPRQTARQARIRRKIVLEQNENKCYGLSGRKSPWTSPCSRGRPRFAAL